MTSRFEYKVVPVPTVCDKRDKSDKDRDPIAATLEAAINDVSVGGWEYVRTETLSMRRGRLRRDAAPVDVMIFRREPYASLQPKFTSSERRQDPIAALPDYRTDRDVKPRRVLAAGSPKRFGVAAE